MLFKKYDFLPREACKIMWLKVLWSRLAHGHMRISSSLIHVKYCPFWPMGLTVLSFGDGPNKILWSSYSIPKGASHWKGGYLNINQSFSWLIINMGLKDVPFLYHNIAPQSRETFGKVVRGFLIDDANVVVKVSSWPREGRSSFYPHKVLSTLVHGSQSFVPWRWTEQNVNSYSNPKDASHGEGGSLNIS